MRTKIGEKSAEKGKILSDSETDAESFKRIISDTDMLTDPRGLASISEASPELSMEIMSIVEDIRTVLKEENKYNKTTFEAKPIDVELKMKKNWTATQIEEANEKLKALSEAKTLKTPVKRKGSSALSRYIRRYGRESVPKGYDVDHTIDLQLGGLDDIINMKPIDRSVNRSLGVQIKNAIKKYPYGTEFGNFTIRQEE